jgi:hypothetical protein
VSEAFAIAILSVLVVLSIAVIWFTRPNRGGPFRKELQEAISDFGKFIASLVGGLVALLVGVAGCLLSVALALAGLFFVVWLLKRMWEAA